MQNQKLREKHFIFSDLIRKHNLKIVAELLNIIGLLIGKHEKIKVDFIKTIYIFNH